MMALTLCRFLLFLIMRAVIVGLGIVFAVFAADISPDFSLGYQGERGVEAKGLLNAGFDADLFSFFTLDGVISFSFAQHNGLNGYALSARFVYPPCRWLNLTIGVQHNHWNDWQAGENRQFLLIRSQPISAVGLGFGFCRREPVFDPNGAHLLRAAPVEYNIVYSVNWWFFKTEKMSLAWVLSNYERLEIENPQRFPFGFNGLYRLSPEWTILGCCRSAINGFSTGLISLTDFKVELGLKYEL